MSDILLFSGGVDSLAAYFYLRKPKTLYVDMQTKYTFKEELAIRRISQMIPKFEVSVFRSINLGQFEQKTNAYIPYRNLILAAIAANYGNRIIIVGTQDDHVEDKNPSAFVKMTECLNFISKPDEVVRLYSPFWNMTKSDIIRWMLVNVPNAEKLLRTSISCYSQEAEQCGRCPSCLRKAVAFAACGLKLDFFSSDVTKCELIPEYIEKMTGADKADYSPRRIAETLEIFEKWGYDVGM